jgi:hypothetical protein
MQLFLLPFTQLMPLRMNGNVVTLADRAEEQQTLRRLRRMKTVSVFTKMSLLDA